MENINIQYGPYARIISTEMGTIIRQRRKSQGWTITELADHCEMDIKALSKFELGKGSISQDNFLDVCYVLGVIFQTSLTNFRFED